MPATCHTVSVNFRTCPTELFRTFGNTLFTVDAVRQWSLLISIVISPAIPTFNYEHDLTKKKRPPVPIPATFVPTLDNLRNFLLTTTTDVLIFFQKLREAP